MQSIVSVLGEGSICIKDLINTSSPDGEVRWGAVLLNENPNNPRQVRRGAVISTLQSNNTPIAFTPKEVLNDQH